MLLFSALFLSACGQPELNPEAYHWDVVLSGFEDTCNAQPQPYQESLTYSLSFDGSAAGLAIGWDTFANGSITGCTIEYASPLIGEDRDAGFVQWVLSGEASLRSGGEACDMGDRVEEVMSDTNLSWDDYSNGLEPSDVDWIGVETFEVEYSEDPSLTAGCTYSILVAGSYRVTG